MAPFWPANYSSSASTVSSSASSAKGVEVGDLRSGHCGGGAERCGSRNQNSCRVEMLAPDQLIERKNIF
jgi:hypothetical protein